MIAIWLQICGAEGVAALDAAVLQPVVEPARRWALVPWVKLSGTTGPGPARCSASSPILAAAFMADSMSPCSSNLSRFCAWLAQTPAKQSACNSSRTLRALYWLWLTLRAHLLHLGADAQQVLHVVAHLVGDHIGLGKFAGRAQLVLQGFVEAQVDVDLLVGRAVERPHRAWPGAAGGADRGRGTAPAWAAGKWPRPWRRPPSRRLRCRPARSRRTSPCGRRPAGLCAGACCCTCGVGAPPPLSRPRIVSGLMPKIAAAHQRDDDRANANAAPADQPPRPPPPPPSRRSSTLSDSRLPSHFILMLLELPRCGKFTRW